MSLPALEPTGFLPPGIHAASLQEVTARFGVGSEVRQGWGELLRQIVEAAAAYPTIKRILVWGSFVTAKPEPNDLDYSLVVSVMHRRVPIAEEHERFLIPIHAKMHYGIDPSYLVLTDYPIMPYMDKLDFITHRRSTRLECGIVEIQMFGEFTEQHP